MTNLRMTTVLIKGQPKFDVFEFVDSDEHAICVRGCFVGSSHEVVTIGIPRTSIAYTILEEA